MKISRIFIFMILMVFVLSSFVIAEETITIYTSVPTEIMTDIKDSFEKEHPNIKLNVFRSGTGTLQAKISTEVETDNLQADIVWLADFAYYESLKKQGLLKKFTPNEADKLLPGFKDKDGYYYAGRVINMIIAYNNNLVKESESPNSWKDLSEDKWYNQCVMANPEYSGAAISAVGAIVSNYGWEYYEELRENDVDVVKGNSTVANKIASGEYKTGIVLDYMIRGMKAKGSPIELKYPEDGIIAIPSPIGIMKNTEKSSACIDFANYILSQKGQETLVKMGSFIPVRGDVEPPMGAPNATELMEQSMDTDWKYIEENLDEIKNKFGDIMLY